MSASTKIPGHELICSLLVARGLITRVQMEEALKVQEKEPELLIGGVLQEMGWIKEEEIIETILLQYNIPYLSPKNYQANPEILAKVDKAFLLANYIFPLDKVDNTLSIITIDPFNRQAIGELEKIFTCAVRPFMGSVPEIKEAIIKFYG
jgi:type IV pilus assembly protein PilB